MTTTTTPTGLAIDFYDPAGTRYGFPTFPYLDAPQGLATRRQLRAAGLRPGGHDPVAQILWRRGKRVAYLYRLDLAVPKRVATPAQREAIAKALRARRTCRLRPGQALLHPPPLRLLPRLPRRCPMTRLTLNFAAQQRTTPDDYVVTALAGDFARRGPLAFEQFLAGYYAESIRIIHETHLVDCTAGDGEPCAMCDAIRVGLAGLLAEQRTVTSTLEEVAGHDRH